MTHQSNTFASYAIDKTVDNYTHICYYEVISDRYRFGMCLAQERSIIMNGYARESELTRDNVNLLDCLVREYREVESQKEMLDRIKDKDAYTR